MRPLTDFDRGWLIGIIEADGCISKDAYWPRITVSMTDRDTVERVALLLGVNLLGPYQPKEPTKTGGKRKCRYTAHFRGEMALHFLEDNVHQFSFRRRQKIAELLNIKHLRAAP